MDLDEAIDELRARADPSRKPGMARVGIDVTHALGVSVPIIRAIAKRAGTDHRLALALWRTGIHEARMLATLVEDPSRFTDAQLERWVRDLTSWDLCDAAADPFIASEPGRRKIREWARRPEGYVKRCAFSMIARLAVSAKTAPDREFLGYLPVIRRGATDPRNEVKKGVSWALRQIGKRNRALNAAAIEEAERLLELGSPPATWVARDALRELRSTAVLRRLPE
jgi:3-methyladenine DNA glycosylase AlkD